MVHKLTGRSWVAGRTWGEGGNGAVVKQNLIGDGITDDEALASGGNTWGTARQ